MVRASPRKKMVPDALEEHSYVYSYGHFLTVLAVVIIVFVCVIGGVQKQLPERHFGNVFASKRFRYGVEEIGGGGGARASEPDRPLTTISEAGVKEVTLADGKHAGQLKIFINNAAVANTVTPANTAGDYSTITFAAVGQSVTLVWTGTGWAVVSRASGDDDNTVDAVKAYPALS